MAVGPGTDLARTSCACRLLCKSNFHRPGNAMSIVERPAAHASTQSAGSVAEVLARTEALIPVLRERAEAVDDLRQMLPASVADLKSAGTARLYQPPRFGGCEA